MALHQRQFIVVGILLYSCISSPCQIKKIVTPNSPTIQQTEAYIARMASQGKVLLVDKEKEQYIRQPEACWAGCETSLFVRLNDRSTLDIKINVQKIIRLNVDTTTSNIGNYGDLHGVTFTFLTNSHPVSYQITNDELYGNTFVKRKAPPVYDNYFSIYFLDLDQAQKFKKAFDHYISIKRCGDDDLFK